MASSASRSFGAWTVYDSVHDQRRGLEFLERPRLEDPLELEVLDVVRRNLRQLAESLALHRPRVGEPVLRLPVGAKQTFERDLRVNPEACEEYRNHKAHQDHEEWFSFLAS